MELNYVDNGIGGSRSTCKFVIDKYGFRVCEKTPTYQDDDFFVRSIIRDAIDMDGWNYNWHMDVSKCVYKSSDERKKVREILDEKIDKRLKEIEHLKKVKQIMGRWGF